MSISLTTNIKRLFSLLPAKVKIQDFYVGEGRPVFVVAEIGNNHNGDFNLALKTILAAKESGANAVKFQRRTVDEVFTKEMRDMPYNNPRSLAPTYGEHREKLEFSPQQLVGLKDYAEDLGLVFFVTPFDQKSADFLESIDVHAYKISSFDVTNLPLLEHVAKKNKPILLSTGMSTIEEIDQAIECILSYNNRLIVNHCTSIYPTPDDKIDLQIVQTLTERYRPLPVGYSGHEPDILPTIMSVGLGAKTVERHFTLDKNMRGSDHHMSIEPSEFKKMVDRIRRAEVFLGSSKKQIHEQEVPIREKHAKSIVTKREIKKGETITKDAVSFKSPGYGFKPALLHRVVGRKANQDLPVDTVILEKFLGS